MPVRGAIPPPADSPQHSAAKRSRRYSHPRLAFGPYPALHALNHILADDHSEACALEAVFRRQAPLFGVEDLSDFGVAEFFSVIGNGGNEAVTLYKGANYDGFAPGGVFGGVIENIAANEAKHVLFGVYFLSVKTVIQHEGDVFFRLCQCIESVGIRSTSSILNDSVWYLPPFRLVPIQARRPSIKRILSSEVFFRLAIMDSISRGVSCSAILNSSDIPMMLEKGARRSCAITDISMLWNWSQSSSSRFLSSVFS